MKKILLVLAAGITIASCNDADKTSEANSAASTTTQASNEATPTATAPSTPVAAEPIQVDTANLTTIQWLDGGDKDFGKIVEGKNLDVSFRFKNTGSKPLVISNVSASCGCTIPETPKKPFAPGETGVIKASFNSTGKVGTQSKQVNVYANTNPGMTTLVFRVEVKAKS
jgi:Protein of unknown function (DUF1573).